MPKRIASLLAAGTEMLFALGLGKDVVAISHECDFPPEALCNPRVTSTRIDVACTSAEIDKQVRASVKAGTPIYHIDAARLAELRPDLIVTQAQCDVCAVSEDDVRALVRSTAWTRDTHIVALDPRTLEAVFRDVHMVAEAAGVADRGRTYVSALRARLDAVRARLSAIPVGERPRTVCIEWMDPLMVAANWIPELIDLAGGRCDLTKAGTASAYTGWGDLLAYDPEVIVIAPCGFDLGRTRGEVDVLTRQERWDDLSAVRAGRVYVVDGNAYFNRSGPRLVDSVELLASMIHPGLIADHLGPDVWRTL